MLDLPQLIADRLHLHHLEVSNFNLISMDPSYIGEFKERMRKAKSKAVDLIVELDPPATKYRGYISVCSPDAEIRAHAIEETKKWIDIAAVLEAPSIMPNQGVGYLPGAVPRPPSPRAGSKTAHVPYQPPPWNRENLQALTPCIEGLKTVVDYGKTKGVAVILEPRGESLDELMYMIMGSGAYSNPQIGTVEGLLLVAIILVAGGAWFILSPEVGRVRIPRSRNALGKVVLKPPVMLATVIGFLLIGACAAVEVGVVASFEHGSLAAGLVLAVFSVGSLAGGLAFGHIPIGPWAMARRLTIVTVGLALTMVMLNAYWLGGTLILAGIGIAPALAVLFAITSASVKFSETAEAFGWAGTGQLIGAAAGSAVAGFLVEVGDWRGAYLAATLFAAAGLVVSVVFVRAFPDLRHRDASPAPDTEPLAVTPS